MATISAEDYLRILQRECFKSHQRLEISNLFADPFFDPSDPWRNLTSGILRDAMQLVPTNDAPKFKRIAVGYLPIGNINACCIVGPFSGYVVALNLGLFFAFQMISLAIIIPSYTNLREIIDSVSLPSEFLESVINCALAGTQDSWEKAIVHMQSANPELLRLAAGGTAAMSVFILLHELGHIANGDLRRGFALATVNPDLTIQYAGAPHRREYSADHYALACTLRDAESKVSAWSAFAWVETLFQLLLRIERRLPSKPTSHPPSRQRLKSLRKTVEARWGPDALGFARKIGAAFDSMDV